MPWLEILCAFLAVIAGVFIVKFFSLRRGIEKMRREMLEKISEDTNTLVSISTRDKIIRRLARDINVQLRYLRDERRKYQSGNAELNEAVVNVSHDLRTPLTAICGYLDLLDEEQKSDEVERYIGIIRNRAETLRRLTEELFNYSLAAGEAQLNLEEISLNSALEESLIAHYAMLKGRGIEPEISITRSSVKRMLDKEALARIFGNIISNAVKYSGGDLAVSLDDNGTVVFSNVAVGIDSIQADRLLDRFYTVETARKSTGLGLSIAKALTERMGGEIKAECVGERLNITIKFN